MNRPFGPTDVSANLKGAVPKTATQKILASLSEKGELTQKQYGGHEFLFLSIHTQSRLMHNRKEHVLCRKTVGPRRHAR